jgi:hypothetical protein
MGITQLSEFKLAGVCIKSLSFLANIKNMKTNFILFIFSILLVSCTTKQADKPQLSVPLTGSWKLLSGTLIENGDTSVTDYTGNSSFIKIINESHFAFLLHDLNKGKDSSAVFVAGGGRYTLSGLTYTEHLEYCTDRAWEGHDFTFEVTIKNDTLIQQGIEKIESEGVNRLNIEKYVKLK